MRLIEIPVKNKTVENQWILLKLKFAKRIHSSYISVIYDFFNKYCNNPDY